MIEDHVERFDSVQPAFALCECWGEKIRAMRVPAQDDFHGLEEEQRLLRIRARRLLTIPLAVLFVALLVTIPQFLWLKGPAHPLFIAINLLVPISIAVFGITYLIASSHRARSAAIRELLRDEYILAFGDLEEDRFPVLVGWPSCYAVKDTMRLTGTSRTQPFTWLTQPVPPEVWETANRSIESLNSMAVAPRVRPMTEFERREVKWLMGYQGYGSERDSYQIVILGVATLVAVFVVLPIWVPGYHRWPPPLHAWGVAALLAAAIFLCLRTPFRRWYWRGLLAADLEAGTVFSQVDAHGNRFEYLPVSEFSWSVNGDRLPMAWQLFFPREPKELEV